MQTLNLDAAIAHALVSAALETLAAVQVVREEGVQDDRVHPDELLPGYEPDDAQPADGVLLRSLTLVSRPTLIYSDQDEDYIVSLVLSREVVSFLRFVATIRQPTLLLPDWLQLAARTWLCGEPAQRSDGRGRRPHSAQACR